MVTISYNLQLNEYFSPKFTQDEHLTDVWYGVSQNSTSFLKWPSHKILNIIQEAQFLNYCKAHQYIRFF